MYNIYIYVYIVYIWLVVLLPSEKSAGHWGSSHCYGIFIQGDLAAMRRCARPPEPWPAQMAPASSSPPP